MRLRRFKAQIEKENWFAVGIAFCQEHVMTHQGDMQMNYKTILGMIGMSLLMTACESLSSGLSPSDLALIEGSSAQWVDKFNRNDWVALSELFTEDGVVMPPNFGPVIGQDAIVAWETENETGFRIAFDVQDVGGSGTLAYVRGRSCVFIPMDDGSYGVDLGKFLEVRRKQANGDWLIIADAFNSDLPVGSDLLTACPFAELPIP